MKILSVAQCNLTVFGNGNDKVQIDQNQLSPKFTASKSIISGAIQGRTPKEIGIIYDSPEEFAIAQTVCNIMPYLYSSEKEAIAVLVECKTIENEIKDLKAKISNLEKKGSIPNSCSCWENIKNIFRKNK